MIIDRLADAVAAIYDGAVAPDRLPDALERLRETFGLVFAASVIRNADASRVEGVAAGVDPVEYRAFLDRFYRRSPYVRAGGSWQPGAVVRAAEIVPHRVFYRTRMYQEFWRPRDMHKGLRLQVAYLPGGGFHSVNLIRPHRARDFGDDDIALARMLMPHLQRAAAIRRRLATADLAAAGAHAALDTLPHAVLLLDAAGRILDTNAAADRLLADGAGVGTISSQLCAATPALTARLHAVIARAAGTPPEAGALRLPQPGAPPLALLAAPLGAKLDWPHPAAAVLVCIVDPAASDAPPGRVLAELFGLTAAEAALAVDLLAGHGLSDLAKRNDRSRNTLRTHLARLMAKTDTRRQSELVRRIAAVPALRPPR